MKSSWWENLQYKNCETLWKRSCICFVCLFIFWKLIVRHLPIHHSLSGLFYIFFSFFPSSVSPSLFAILSSSFLSSSLLPSFLFFISLIYSYFFSSFLSTQHSFSFLIATICSVCFWDPPTGTNSLSTLDNMIQWSIGFRVNQSRQLQVSTSAIANSGKCTWLKSGYLQLKFLLEILEFLF